MIIEIYIKKKMKNCKCLYVSSSKTIKINANIMNNLWAFRLSMGYTFYTYNMTFLN